MARYYTVLRSEVGARGWRGGTYVLRGGRSSGGSKWLSGSGALALRSACNINKQARRIGEKKYPPSLFEVRLLTGPGGDCMCLEQLLATYDPP